ncbi:MAG: hypothetical protein AAFO07_07315 [Bacteroidota bacterium]
MAKFPREDGWITARLTLETPGSEPDKESMIGFLTGGKTENYELGEYKLFKTLVRVVFRKKKESPTDCNQ